MNTRSFGSLPLENRLLEVIEQFEPAARAELVTALTSSEEARANLIRQFWGRQQVTRSRRS